MLSTALALAQAGGGLVAEGEIFRIAGDARKMARLVAAEFDAYRAGSTARHSLAV